ncbi:multidrug effflux MFS transporter [Vibrio sp. SCSIO 43136]|uniref:multidrug effflux MFS transporter n=1 Tax=Vibrio sp. SCSIO 43136 TaxID=2819101 RepID=UPI0020765DF9|nr:multidrug effflux MFS transporter [Vibrio sp. SCSIO 43136]USD68003.1 multidrug effflux MFS transporter [Vibrio sp. SCSIO 43136]
MPTSIQYKTILLACLIISIGQLSMGLVFPALPWIAKDFHMPLDEAQLLIAGYLFGFGPSQFIYGPISDALGRKKVLLAGLAIALVGIGVIVLMQDNFYGMVAGRFIQGLGTGCCAVLARASTRDRYSGAHLPTAMSYIAMVASITPLVAPVFGGFINAHFGWQMVFVSLFCYVALAYMVLSIRFDETMVNKSQIPNPKAMLSQYKALLTSKYFVSFAGIGWLNFSLMITTISVMPFIMQNQIGMSSDEYALWAIIPALGMLLGTSLSNRLRPVLGAKRLLLCTPVLQILSAMWLFTCPIEPIYMMLGQLIMTTSNGMALPVSQAMVLQPYKKEAGSAAAMAGGGQMLVSAIMSMLLVQVGLSQPWHIALVALGFALVTVANIFRGFAATTPNSP